MFKNRRLLGNARRYPAHPMLAIDAVVFKTDPVLLGKRKNSSSLHDKKKEIGVQK